MDGVVILLSRGEFGHERNKIYYQRVFVLTFCYTSNLWYDIVILDRQHVFILRITWREKSYFVFNLGVNVTPRFFIWYMFWKYLLKESNLYLHQPYL